MVVMFVAFVLVVVLGGTQGKEEGGMKYCD
jgi:hypothetical protein